MSAELCSLLAQLLHKRGACRPALNNVLLLDVMERAAPPEPESAERPLPPSWRKVPSASRPGEFSYLHLPTGFKQAFFPESDEPDAECLEQVKALYGQLLAAIDANGDGKLSVEEVAAFFKAQVEG